MFKYLVLIAIFLTGCQNINGDTLKNTTIFSKFPNTEKITFKNFIKFENGPVSRIFLRDTTLIAYDWRAKSGYFFYEYGLNSKLNVAKYIPHGRGKGDALGSLSAGISNKSLWMYDISLSKIIFADLKTTATEAISYKEYPFSQNYYNIQFLDSSKVIANGNYKTPKKLQEVDLNSGKVLADYGLINNVPTNIPFYAWKRVNEAFLVLKPTKDKAVLAHRLTDQIEIFNLKNHESLTIKGPENFEAEFKSFKSNDNEDLISRNEKSRYAFVQAVATDKYIYLLYSGNNMSSQYIDYAKTVYVYDWDGKPIKKIDFDRYVSGLAVDNKNQTLYAFDVISKFIVTTKI
jgi:TolB-like 6-blade propeller-like